MGYPDGMPSGVLTKSPRQEARERREDQMATEDMSNVQAIGMILDSLSSEVEAYSECALMGGIECFNKSKKKRIDVARLLHDRLHSGKAQNELFGVIEEWDYTFDLWEKYKELRKLNNTHDVYMMIVDGEISYEE